MLDRMISGAGAVTDAADRSVRLLASGSRRGLATTRPGSVVVAAILLVLAACSSLAGLEATDPRDAGRRSTPPAVADGRDLGEPDLRDAQRVARHAAWVETYEDVNDNGVEDADERRHAWYYWLVDPTGQGGRDGPDRRDRPRRSSRSTASGTLVDRAAAISNGTTSRTVRRGDRRSGCRSSPTSSSTPTGGRRRQRHAARSGRDAPGQRDAGRRVRRADRVVARGLHQRRRRRRRVRPRRGGPVRDPRLRPGVRSTPSASSSTTSRSSSRRRRSPVAPPRGTRRGRVRDDRRPRLRRATISSSRRPYILDDGTAPRSAPLAFVLAAVLAGRRRDHPRRAGRRLPHLSPWRRRGSRRRPRRSGPASALPLRITGVVRTPTGLEHVREAPGELIRFVLGRAGPPPDRGARPPRPTVARGRPPTDPPSSSGRATRRASPLGLGELVRLSSGRGHGASAAPGPALRVVAGTGPLSCRSTARRSATAPPRNSSTNRASGRDGTHIRTP